MGKVSSAANGLYEVGQQFTKLRDSLGDNIIDPVTDQQASKIYTKAAEVAATPELAAYQLEVREILPVALMWYELVEKNYSSFTPLEILQTIYGPTGDRIIQLSIYQILLGKAVLAMGVRLANPFENLFTTNSKNSEAFKLKNLLENDVTFDNSFLSRLLNEPDESQQFWDTPYKSNKDFLDDWFGYIEALMEYSYHDMPQFRRGRELCETAAEDYMKVNRWKARIDSRTKLTKRSFPLLDIVDEYCLDENEETILVYLAKCEIDEYPVDHDEVLRLISHDRLEQFQNKKYLTADSKLVRNHLIESPDGIYFKSRGGEVRLMPDVMKRMILKTPMNDTERLDQILRGNDILTLIDPQHSLDDLILQADLKKFITKSLARYEDNTDQILRSWQLFDGVNPTQGLNKRMGEPGLLMLFHGPPGTGKTFAAGAIAHTLGKKLLITDMSRIQSMWVGESEKNVRRLFATFEQIVRRLDNPPVLLFNEADQFLSKRLTSARNSVDLMHNTLQNLFLEAFERLRGVMIATTNLRENLDPAFGRRFHLKMELPVPGPKEREQLWKLHVPESIPGATDIGFSELAEKYILTGGQISVIVQNAATAAAARKGRWKKLTVSDLTKYCEIELEMSQVKNRGIGFHV